MNEFMKWLLDDSKDYSKVEKLLADYVRANNIEEKRRAAAAFDKMIERTREQCKEHPEIGETYRMMFEDSTIRADIDRRIDNGESAPRAVIKVYAEQADFLENSGVDSIETQEAEYILSKSAEIRGLGKTIAELIIKELIK